LLKFTKIISTVIPCGPYLTSWSSWCVDQSLGWLKVGTFHLCLFSFSLSFFSIPFLFFLQYFFSYVSLFCGWLRDFKNIWGENKLKIFFRWDGSSYTMNMKVGELWVYWQWTRTPEWTYAHQYFWMRLATKFHKGRNWFQKILKIKKTHSLTKLNTNKSCYVNNYLVVVEM
jgi:hypothetical protein